MSTVAPDSMPCDVHSNINAVSTPSVLVLQVLTHASQAKALHAAE